MTKPTILIHIDEARRDILYCLYLKYGLERNGWDVTLANRNSLPHYLKFVNFNAILVPGHNYLGSVQRAKELSKESTIYLLSTEGAQISERFLTMKYTGALDNPEESKTRAPLISRYYLWGRYSYNVLKKMGYFDEKQLLISGAPRFQFLISYEERQPDIRQKPVGFVSRLSGFNPYTPDRRNIFKLLDGTRKGSVGYTIDEDRNVEDLRWLDYATARLTMEFLDECKERNIKVKYRPHPREDLTSYDYLREKYRDILDFSDIDVPFELWINEVSCIVSFNSTTFYETIYSGVPSITLTPLMGERIYDHIRLPDYHSPIREYVYNPNSFADVFKAIDAVRKGDFKFGSEERIKQAKEQIEEMFDGYSPETALEKIISDINFNTTIKKKTFMQQCRYRLEKLFVQIAIWGKNSIYFYILRNEQYGSSYFLKPRKEWNKYREIIIKSYKKFHGKPADLNNSKNLVDSLK